MSIQIDILGSLDKAKTVIDRIKFKAVPKAARRSLNRVITASRVRAIKGIKRRRKLKPTELKKKFVLLKKARGSRIDKLQAEILFNRNPVSAIRFLVGPKQPSKQKGVKVKKRRVVRLHVKPGRRTKMPKAFIARGRGGNLQIFQRRGKKRFPIVKRGTAAISTVVDKSGLGKRLQKFAQKRLDIEFQRNLEHELNQIKSPALR